jgi:uncharacterized Zn finger protein (UPF0148 family)
MWSRLVLDMTAIKCRRGGCGTIIEEFWQFCPSCGTQVSFEDREAVAGRQSHKLNRRKGEQRVDAKRSRSSTDRASTVAAEARPPDPIALRVNRKRGRTAAKMALGKVLTARKRK